jgi:phosphoglycolate phosphatase-like HAD superfamily hydrolase
MPLRVAFDMDGVLADFGLAFREVETRLLGSGRAATAGDPGREEEAKETVARRAEAVSSASAPALDENDVLREYESEIPEAAEGVRTAKMSPARDRRRRDLVWRTIQSTPNFWSTLKPIDPEAVRRIHAMSLRHGWEVFFITQRPRTDGETVQRQTQRWLVDQGFDLPSVLVLTGSRGAAAAALRLDYLVDDTAQNCLDVIADSRARPILIVPNKDESTVASARKLGVGTARSISECLDLLDKAAAAHNQPGLLQRLASLVGWR